MTLTHSFTMRLEGLRLASVNQRAGSKLAAIIESGATKRVRDRAQLEVMSRLWKELGPPAPLGLWKELGPPAPLGLPARPAPTSLHVVRVGPGRLDDDNLIASTKHLLDGVARALGIDDKRFVIVGNRPGPRVTFDQRKEGPGAYAAELTFTFELESSRRRRRVS